MDIEQEKSLSCFKAYDVRGRVPDELNEDLAFKIGRSFATYLNARRVVVGYDIRLSSNTLVSSLSKGVIFSGAEVLNIGLCGTEEVYYATAALDADGGIMVTASHNPVEYNGMKFVRREARPISNDTGLAEIRKMVLADSSRGRDGGDLSDSMHRINMRDQYVEHILSYIEPASLMPISAVVNAGNGCAGPVIDQLERKLPITLIKLQHEPDGSFPNGVPNPLLQENRKATAEAVIREKADIGIAWDGDFDRCFLFDEKGYFVEGYYLVGLLAQAMLQGENEPRKIIHDPRLFWNTREIVLRAGHTPVLSKTGHAFIKEKMRAEDALYGGEMSGHHYFRNFNYCDSGMIPWLLVWQLMSRTGKPLSELFAERMELFPVSGEINRKVEDPDGVLARIEKRYRDEPCERDYTDGLSISCDTFRFNVRKSNTEPLLRLNVESRGDRALMEAKTKELLRLIDETGS
ncbi:MAG: phosphomannomutase [Deltaproteobacteria bacterium]|jgi:phosphomannomutase/phosphomannomutase/phosphoglucomutase|nr:phosphomannomutase [Deltaproteobacteria bacterium]